MNDTKARYLIARLSYPVSGSVNPISVSVLQTEKWYELAILAVVDRVVEALVAQLNINYTNLSSLVYKVLFDWFERKLYGGGYGEGLRRLAIGNGPDPINGRG